MLLAVSPFEVANDSRDREVVVCCAGYLGTLDITANLLKSLEVKQAGAVKLSNCTTL